MLASVARNSIQKLVSAIPVGLGRVLTKEIIGIETKKTRSRRTLQCKVNLDQYEPIYKLNFSEKYPSRM